MEPGKLYQEPHRRLNPLTQEWVLVSPHRMHRPWQGQVEGPVSAPAQTYDPDCYLCPGNERAGGARNPKYLTTFVFTNDFAALKPDVESARQDDSGRGLLLSEAEAGTCKVVCFSPRHDLTLARMTVAEIACVVDVWAEQHVEIGSLPISTTYRSSRIAARSWDAAIRTRTVKSGPIRPFPMSHAKSRNHSRRI